MVRRADGKEKPDSVNVGPGFRYQPVWSPDSKWLVFRDHESKFYLFDLQQRNARSFDRVNITGWRLGVPSQFRWSSDSQWLTYTKANRDNMNVVMLYNVQKDELHQVTAGMFVDYLPTFDRKGDYLYFFSEREISGPENADAGLTFIYKNTGVLHAIPLREEVAHPFKPESDEEGDEAEEEKEKKDDKSKQDEAPNKDDKQVEDAVDSPDDDDSDGASGDKDDDQSAAPDTDKDDDHDEEEKDKSVEIEVADMESRAFRFPIKRGGFSFLAVNNKNQLIYLRVGEENTLQLFDPADEKREEKTILAKVSQVQITPDGKKLLVRSGEKTGIIDAKPSQKLENIVVTEPMSVVIEPRDEWRQIFADAWRFMRDYFYDPTMHRSAAQRRFARWLPLAVALVVISMVAAAAAQQRQGAERRRGANQGDRVRPPVAARRRRSPRRIGGSRFLLSPEFLFGEILARQRIEDHRLDIDVVPLDFVGL